MTSSMIRAHRLPVLHLRHVPTPIEPVNADVTGDAQRVFARNDSIPGADHDPTGQREPRQAFGDRHGLRTARKEPPGEKGLAVAQVAVL
jgi:hypothetical protein